MVEFIVVIRGRNCEKYIAKCLHSLQKQTHTNWRAMVVLDAPKDNSPQVVASIQDKPGGPIYWHVNEEHKGLCHNMYFAIKWAASILRPNDDTVFVILDADDKLSPTALQTVARVYEKHPKTLVTHGSYIKLSKGRKTKVSKPYPKSGNVRKLPWRASHLKTMKWKVLKHIDYKWFQHKGKWLEAASDLALMFPVIELAGLKNVRHIPDPIYIWRDNKNMVKIQRKCERILRSK